MEPREKAALLPESPGVYLFKDALGTILYVGKSRSLRNRVKASASSCVTVPPGQEPFVDVSLKLRATGAVAPNSVLKTLTLTVFVPVELPAGIR